MENLLINIKNSTHSETHTPLYTLDSRMAQLDRMLNANMNEIKFLEGLISSSRIQSSNILDSLVGGTRMVQSLQSNIRRLKRTMESELENRNLLAQALGKEEITVHDIGKNDSSLWNNLGREATEKLMNFLHYKRLTEELAFVEQDISRTMKHIDEDIELLTVASIRMHPNYTMAAVEALNAARNDFISKLSSIKEAIESTK